MPKTAKKQPVIRVVYELEKGQWVAKGPRIRVKAPTLQAARHRARKAATKAHGSLIELDNQLKVSDALQRKIDANCKTRERLLKERKELRRQTIEIVEELRSDFEAGYRDAAKLLGVETTVLTRLMRGDDE